MHYLRKLIPLVVLLLVISGCNGGDPPAPTSTPVDPTSPEGLIEDPRETPIAEAVATVVPDLTETPAELETPTTEAIEAPTEVPEEEATATAADAVVEQEGTVFDPLERAEPIALTLIAEGLTAPTYLVSAPDESGALFIVDQIGEIRVVDAGGELQEEPFLDLTNQIVELRESFDERGLLGLAFHPQFEENGRFFVYYSAPMRDEAADDWNHTSHISEFQAADGDMTHADPDSERIILQVDQPQFNHNGGTVAFGTDGYLYISLGDGGDADDTGLGHPPEGNGQDRTTILGSILRIDVDGDEPYAIPDDNPFVEEEGLPEIYAYGLRNPYRFSWDMEGNGELYVADAGQYLYEEVSLVTQGATMAGTSKRGPTASTRTTHARPWKAALTRGRAANR